jgi:hypothetical protein
MDRCLCREGWLHAWDSGLRLFCESPQGLHTTPRKGATVQVRGEESSLFLSTAYTTWS